MTLPPDMVMPVLAPTVSPCTGICRIDEANQLCPGCARSPDEIAVWRGAEPAFRAAAGTDLAGLPAAEGAALLAASPVRVVETALGRAEGATPIPPPGGRSPDGPHMHLLPDHLATGLATPVSLPVPRAYLPGALLYPRC